MTGLKNPIVYIVRLNDDVLTFNKIDFLQFKMTTY